PTCSTLFPYTTLFRSMLLQVRQIPGVQAAYKDAVVPLPQPTGVKHPAHELPGLLTADAETIGEPMTEQQIADFAASHPDAYRFTDRKSTRLNSSHVAI